MYCVQSVIETGSMASKGMKVILNLAYCEIASGMGHSRKLDYVLAGYKCRTGCSTL